MAPTAPVITTPADGAVLTANTVSVSGTAEADGSLVLYNGNDELVTVTSSGGSWSALLSLADGEYALWASLTTADGTSEASVDVHVTVSGQPQPSTDPSPESDAASPAPEPEGASDQGAPAEGVTGAPEVPPAGGTDLQVPGPVEPAPSAEVVPDATAPGGGTQISPQANAETAAAAAPEAGADPVAPAPPEAPVIEVPHADEEFADNLVTVSGTAEPSGAAVIVYADAKAIGTASVDDKGDWSIEANLPNGEYELSASVNDAGRASARGDAVHIVVNHDASAPAAEPSDDPEERFVEFLESRILRGYPLRWSLIQELRQHAQAWVDHRKASQG